MANIAEKGCALLSSTAGVDLNADADTTLYEVPAGKKCVVHYVVIRNLSADTQAAVGSFGQSGTTTDFVGNQTLAALDSAGDAGIIMPVPAAATVVIQEYTAGELFVFDVTTVAGGACTCTIDVFGYLL